MGWGGLLQFCIAKLGFVEACLGLEASLRATKYLLSLDRPCAVFLRGVIERSWVLLSATERLTEPGFHECAVLGCD